MKGAGELSEVTSKKLNDLSSKYSLHMLAAQDMIADLTETLRVLEMVAAALHCIAPWSLVLAKVTLCHQPIRMEGGTEEPE